MRVPPFHWWRTVVLPDSRNCRLHHRARHVSLAVESLRPPRLLRARVCARVVVAHPCHDWRVGARPGPRAAWRATAPTSSCRITRASTTSRCCSPRCRCSCASSRRSRSARFPFLGWHLRRTGHLLVDRRQSRSRRDPATWRDAGRRRACRSSSFRKAHGAPMGAWASFKAGQFRAGGRSGSDRSSRVGRWHAAS